MGRKAKPLQQQIELLRKRGMRIDEADRARGFLMEIGWYRMSLYWFPFELRYPDPVDPVHLFKPDTTFRDALMLYAFDFNLRHLLLKPLERIETAFRTYLIHYVSTRYPDSPAWFCDRQVVTGVAARSFDHTVYTPLRRNNYHIQLHHRRFPGDKYAPAWKTLEFVTLGTICNLYCALTNASLRHDIAQHFGFRHEEVFRQYLDVIRELRNLCAHGGVLYDYRMSPLRQGPAMNGKQTPPQNLRGALNVVEYFLERISPRLYEEFRTSFHELLQKSCAETGTRRVLREISGFHFHFRDGRG